MLRKVARRVNGKKIIRWDVEEHLGGKQGIGMGKRTGQYDSEGSAINAMIRAKADGNGATCIARNRDGAGVMLTLALATLP